VAVTLCVAAPSAPVVHFAVRLSPTPASAIAAEHPVIEAPPSLKITDPVGAVPLTVAVKVTATPALDGVSEVTRSVELTTLLTVCESAGLVETALVASPLYLAVMVRTPATRPLVVHAAVPVFPLPARATAEQPVIETVPSLKVTVPVGETPPTVAVKVTLEPTVIGICELTMPVVLAALLIVCVRLELVDGLFDASPVYAMAMLCVPAARPLVVHVAEAVLPAPANGTAAQPEIELPPSVKLSVPVGLKPVTDPVNVTGAANAAGLTELDRVVVVVAMFTSWDSVELVEPALFASPP